MQSFRRRGTFSRSLLSDQLSVNDLSVLDLSTWKRIKLPIEKYHVSTPSYRSSIDLFCVEREREKKKITRNHLYYHNCSAQNFSNILFSLFIETRFLPSNNVDQVSHPSSRNFSSLRLAILPPLCFPPTSKKAPFVSPRGFNTQISRNRHETIGERKKKRKRKRKEIAS